MNSGEPKTQPFHGFYIIRKHMILIFFFGEIKKHLICLNWDETFQFSRQNIDPRIQNHTLLLYSPVWGWIRERERETQQRMCKLGWVEQGLLNSFIICKNKPMMHRYRYGYWYDMGTGTGDKTFFQTLRIRYVGDTTII